MTTHRAPTDPVGADLTRLLKALKLGALADTLPQRAALARQHKLSHIGFLETLLADEVSRRESRSAALRAAKAGLDPTMRFETWTAQEDLRYDRTLLADLTSLRFLDAGQSAIILGPVGVDTPGNSTGTHGNSTTPHRIVRPIRQAVHPTARRPPRQHRRRRDPPPGHHRRPHHRRESPWV